MAPASVVIIGGGVSGLSTAYFLSKHGIRSTILEKSNRLGGLIRTELVEGCRLEAGPDSYLAAKPEVTELTEEINGLKGQIIGSNDRQRRIFVARGEKLIALPKGMIMIAPGEWLPILRSNLFSAKTKLRFLQEPFTPPRARSGDISVAELVRDHFGQEVLDYLADPLLAGVYGGDSSSLSAQSVLPRFVAFEQRYGSLIRGVRRERHSQSRASLFLSFAEGMQMLTDSLGKAITSSTKVSYTRALGVEKRATGWRVLTADGHLDAAHLVLACPAHAAAEILQSFAQPLASELAAIPYSSTILTTFIYSRAEIAPPLDGFGFLVPRAERKTIAAATWVSTKFPSRIPSHLFAIRAFIVDPEASNLMHVAHEDVLAHAQADLRRLMHIEAPPLHAKVHAWPSSMPQYVVGHRHRLATIADLLKGHPGLHLAGNAYDGVGIPDCLRLAKETAKRIFEEGAQ